MNNAFIVFLLGFTLFLPLLARASEDGHKDETTLQAAPIDSQTARDAGLASNPVGPGIIEQRLRVYGELVVHPDRLARVSARFPGLAQNVHAQLGDKLDAGAPLVDIESDQSLSIYTLRAPINGTVIARQISLGEYTRNLPLFTIANLDKLRLELKVFPGQLDRIRPGQPLELALARNIEGATVTSRIEHLLPATDGVPFIHAVADIPNPDATLVPGQQVEADIITLRQPVALSVPLSALQSIDGQAVVFVSDGEHYQPRPVKLGLRDRANAEVLSGLSPGELVVTANSYLVKADLEKAGASHAH